jgi:hypothetical protein
MKYRTKAFSFYVTGYFGSMKVEGFAIENETGIKLTAHQNSIGDWVISDFDTGFSVFIGDEFVWTKARSPNFYESIEMALKMVKSKVKTGDYAKAAKKAKEKLKTMKEEYQ